MLVGGALTGLALLQSCANPPTTDEINDQYDYFVNLTYEYYQKLVDACLQNSSDPDACCDLAWQWLQDELSRLNQAHNDAINENWQDAYERRREWEEEFREMFPDWPGINELLEPTMNGLELSADVSIEPIESGGGVVVQGGGTIEHVTWSGYEISGTMSIREPGEEDMVVDLSGNVVIASNDNDFHVDSGEMTMSVLGVEIGTMLVIDDWQNVVHLDSNGNGTMSVLIAASYLDEEWKAVLPYYNRLQIPISSGENGAFHVQFPWTEGSEFVFHYPWTASDYDDNGVLEYNFDSAAFMEGWSVRELLADSNVDGVWDQADIDLWEGRFWKDYEDATQ